MADYPVQGLRLNADIPEEAKVIEIIEAAKQNGHSFKSLVMTLILDAEGIVTDSPLSVAKELSDTVENLKSLLDTLQTNGHITAHKPPVERSPEDHAVSLDDDLIQSIVSNKPKRRERNK